MGERERGERCSEGRRPGGRRGRAGTRLEVRGGPACGTVLGAQQQHAGRRAPRLASCQGQGGSSRDWKSWASGGTWPPPPQVAWLPRAGFLQTPPPPRNRSLQPEAK